MKPNKSFERSIKSDPGLPGLAGDEPQLGLIGEAIERAQRALLELQHPDGYWCFELEADCTIPAEYVLMMHYLDEIDEDLEAKIGVYIRERQMEDGGWPLYTGGEANVSCTVKAYFALKLIGDFPEAPHMAIARERVLAMGGAARCNVFTRIALALFEQIPWRGVPFIPVEIVLLPRWFPFHLLKISYWSRTVMVPLIILCTLKPRAKNPRNISIRELFTMAPEEERDYFPVRSCLNYLFLGFDKLGRTLEPVIPRSLRRHALKKAEEWFVERLNGDSGLGAIFPAMVNAYEALRCLGYAADHPYCVTARLAIRKLLVVEEERAYCQPCVSPVWDTALASLTLLEGREPEMMLSVNRALEWLVGLQLLDQPGDWSEYRPNLRGGGWPFQFRNSHYPDLDDTAVAALAMVRSEEDHFEEPVKRAAEWLAGMQSKNGGFAAFDADNCYYYLNEIPFADHGALLDPPTSDVSARCLMFLSAMKGGRETYRPVLHSCLKFLREEQEEDGSWFGRWGTNYIYGTWSVLIAFELAGIGKNDPVIRKAIDWLKERQRVDGGWGESNDSYTMVEARGRAEQSNSFQTAWAVLGLLAGGEVNSSAVERGIRFLLERQSAGGLWEDEGFTAPGFPRVFYLKYHGYDKFFPLWALSRYRRLQTIEKRDGNA